MLHFFAAGTRKLIVLLGAFFAFALLAACSPQKPENVVKDYLQAVSDKSFADAIACFSLKDVKKDEFEATVEKLKQRIDHQYRMIQENGGLESISLKFEDKNDVTAHANIEVKYIKGKTEKSQLTLVNESGMWKIKLE